MWFTNIELKFYIQIIIGQKEFVTVSLDWKRKSGLLHFVSTATSLILSMLKKNVTNIFYT